MKDRFVKATARVVDARTLCKNLSREHQKVHELLDPVMKLSDRPKLLNKSFTTHTLAEIEGHLMLLDATLTATKMRFGQMEAAVREMADLVIENDLLTRNAAYSAASPPTNASGKTLEQAFEEHETLFGIAGDDLDFLYDESSKRLGNLGALSGL